MFDAYVRVLFRLDGITLTARTIILAVGVKNWSRKARGRAVWTASDWPTAHLLHRRRAVGA